MQNNSLCLPSSTKLTRNEVQTIIENLSSNNIDHHFIPKIHFFIPEIIIKIKCDQAVIFHDVNYTKLAIDRLFNEICSITLSQQKIPSLRIKSRVSKNDYIKNIFSIQEHLKQGDIYEMNYCQEFYVENIDVDPFCVFDKLNNISSAPFSSFYRLNHNFCICASPERYIKKTNNISNSWSQFVKKNPNRLR